MSKYNKKTQQEFKFAMVYLFLQKAKNGGICKVVEREKLNQEPRHFNKAVFDHETRKLTIEFDNQTIVTILPVNFGIEMVEPENNPDYKGYQRMGIWDSKSMYCFDVKW